MAIVAYQPFEPRQQHRFLLEVGDIQTYIVRTATLPVLNNNPRIVDQVNHDFKVKGKSRWEDITITLYDPVDRSGAQVAHLWIKRHHISPSNVDGYKTGYQEDLTLKYLDPQGSPKGMWTLYNSFIGNSNWGNVDVTSDDLVLLELTIVYDYAIYTGP